MRSVREIPESSGPRQWRDSNHVCALCDDERHLGHVVEIGRWHAFDATKPSLTENGFRYVGSFSTAEAAKRAVDESVAASGPARGMVRAAGVSSHEWNV